MRLYLLAALWAASATVYAAPVNVGGAQVEVPTPDGFVPVTDAMGRYKQFSERFVSPDTRRLTLFIPGDRARQALAGEIPKAPRRIAVSVARELEAVDISARDWAEIKAQYEGSIKEQLHSIKSDVNANVAKASRAAGKEMGKDLLVQVDTMTQLPPHQVDDDVVASSMYVKGDAVVDGTATNSLSVFTLALVHVANRVIFVHVYGTRDDLEWTRNEARDVAASILDSAERPSRTVAAASLPSPTQTKAGSPQPTKIYVDATEVIFQAPAGFDLITAADGKYHQVASRFVSPANQQLALFLESAKAVEVRAGGIPQAERRISVETPRKAAEMILTDKDFAAVSRGFSRSMQGQADELRSKTNAQLKATGKGATQDLGVETSFVVKDMTAYPPHLSTDQAVALSVLQTNLITSGGVAEEYVNTTTAAVVHVNGKLLFVYVYGGKKDLDWTRITTREIVDSMLSNATKAPVVSPASARDSGYAAGVEWGRIAAKAVAYGILGLIVAGIAALWRRLTKKPVRQ